MHNSNKNVIRHCPGCGAEGIEWQSAKEIVCGKCGFDLFLNTAAAVGALILVGDDILLTRRATEPYEGLLDVPGGFIDQRESAEDGLRRELREELGLEVGELAYFRSFPNEYPYKGVLYHALDMFFMAKMDKRPEVRALEEVSEVVWVKRSEIDLEQVAFPSVRNVLGLIRQA